MKPWKLSPADMALIALFAALMAVCAWISISSAIPFTMQTFGLFLTLGLLGGKRGMLAVLVYLLLGLTGIPVFSGFRGGFGVIAGITGGYLIGFLPAAAAYWLITLKRGGLPPMAIGMAAGLLIDYALGTAWFMLFYARTYGAIGLSAALSMCVLPYVLPDLVKLAIAAAAAHALPKRVKALR